MNDFDTSLDAWPPRLLTEIVADGDVGELLATLDAGDAWDAAERARLELPEDWAARERTWRSARDEGGRTLMMIAIAAHHAAMIPHLAARGALLGVPRARELANPLGPWGGARDLYHFAATCADLPTLEALRPFADPRAADEAGATPLHYAANAGRSDLFAWFVNHGVDLEAMDAFGCTALNYAATALTPLDELLRLGAAPDGGPGEDAPPYLRGRPLLLALRRAPECFDRLLEAGADLALVPTACEDAARAPERLARLLDRGCVPTARALEHAARDGSHRSVSLLLDRAPFVEKALVAAVHACLLPLAPRDSRRPSWTPEREQLLTRLLTTPSREGGSLATRAQHALLCSASIDRPEPLAVALALGAAPDGTVYVDHPRGANGGTALHVAAARLAETTTRALLAAGASVEVQDRVGRRPLDVAAEVAPAPSQGAARRAILGLLVERERGPTQPAPGLAVGARVTHPKFGEGLIDKIDGEGDAARLTVRFGAETKTLLARFVRPST